MHQVPFQLFGVQHLVTLFACFALIVLLPFYFRNKSSETNKENKNGDSMPEGCFDIPI